MSNLTPQTSLRTLVIASDPLARAGLAGLLAEQPGCTVVGQAAGEGLTVEQVALYAPDVIVWDSGWDAATGLEHIIEAGDLGVPVLALIADSVYAADAWMAGARGLFLRNTKIESVTAALSAVARGLVVIDPAVAPALLSPRERAAPLIEELTTRESEVLQLLAEGYSNKALAQRLGISESTVKFHVNAIMGKLGAQSRTDAVVRATRLGLIIL
ncbi:MAG TPA: response regulator transcription factor [Aggregatilineales bacterium]|nr:response regulator transcription factor [Aggregatilineales bacterium]